MQGARHPEWGTVHVFRGNVGIFGGDFAYARRQGEGHPLTMPSPPPTIDCKPSPDVPRPSSDDWKPSLDDPSRPGPRPTVTSPSPTKYAALGEMSGETGIRRGRGWERGGGSNPRGEAVFRRGSGQIMLCDSPVSGFPVLAVVFLRSHRGVWQVPGPYGGNKQSLPAACLQMWI